MLCRSAAITLALVLAAAAAAPIAQAQPKAAQGAGPRLAVAQPLRDFGTVAKGEKIRHVFEIRNSGSATLEIIAARPNCGCTVAEFDRTIAPGGTGRVTAIVDTAAFAGPISKSVTIETNDPNAPTAQLTMNAIVKPFVEAYPAGFVRYNLLEGQTETQTVTLYSEQTEPFRIVRIESPQPWIRVTHRPVAAPLPSLGRPGQAQHAIGVKVGGPGTKVGPLAEKIRIVTNSTRQPEFLLSVSGVVRPAFRIEPTAVNFGEVAPTDTAATRTILLRSNNLRAPESFVATRVESSIQGIGATLRPTDRRGEYEVTLLVARDTRPGEVDGQVVVHTSDPARPRVVIPVKGTIRASR